MSDGDVFVTVTKDLLEQLDLYGYEYVCGESQPGATKFRLGLKVFGESGCRCCGRSLMVRIMCRWKLLVTSSTLFIGVDRDVITTLKLGCFFNKFSRLIILMNE